jgi:hypothetical protein
MPAQPDVTQILAGPGLIYIAPLGTPLPPIAFPLVWNPAWFLVGYTEAGIDATYTPHITPQYVDEEAAPVMDILEKEEYSISAILAEASLENLLVAISASTYTPGTTPHLSAGSQALNYFMVGVTGPAVDTYNVRLILMQKAISLGPVAVKITRKKYQTFAVKLDARKLAGQNLFDQYDIGTGYEAS